MPRVAPTAPWPPTPRAALRSARLRPAALTRTRISCGFGFGCGISRTSKPLSVATAAFILKSPRPGLMGLDEAYRTGRDVEARTGGFHLPLEGEGRPP